MKNAKIQVQYECPNCEGECIVNSPFWDTFYERVRIYKEANKHIPSREMDDIEEGWLREMGYSGFNDRTLPSEQPTCARCEGAGVVVEWVSIGVIFEATS